MFLRDNQAQIKMYRYLMHQSKGMSIFQLINLKKIGLKLKVH